MVGITVVLLLLTEIFAGQYRRIEGKRLLKEVSIDLSAERKRSSDTDFCYVNTKIDQEYKEIPPKAAMTRDEIFGRTPCRVAIKLTFVKENLNMDHRTVCLFKAEVPVVLHDTVITMGDSPVPKEAIYEWTEAVVGFVVNEPASHVQGYIIKRHFYGTIRMYDKYHLYHVAFYVEPLEYVALYGGTELYRSHGSNGILFEYVPTVSGSWVPCKPVVRHTTKATMMPNVTLEPSQLPEVISDIPAFAPPEVIVTEGTTDRPRTTAKGTEVPKVTTERPRTTAKSTAVPKVTTERSITTMELKKASFRASTELTRRPTTEEVTTAAEITTIATTSTRIEATTTSAEVSTTAKTTSFTMAATSTTSKSTQATKGSTTVTAESTTVTSESTTATSESTTASSESTTASSESTAVTLTSTASTTESTATTEHTESVATTVATTAEVTASTTEEQSSTTGSRSPSSTTPTLACTNDNTTENVETTTRTSSHAKITVKKDLQTVTQPYFSTDRDELGPTTPKMQIQNKTYAAPVVRNDNPTVAVTVSLDNVFSTDANDYTKAHAFTTIKPQKSKASTPSETSTMAKTSTLPSLTIKITSTTPTAASTTSSKSTPEFTSAMATSIPSTTEATSESHTYSPSSVSTTMTPKKVPPIHFSTERYPKFSTDADGKESFFVPTEPTIFNWRALTAPGNDYSDAKAVLSDDAPSADQLAVPIYDPSNARNAPSNVLSTEPVTRRKQFVATQPYISTEKVTKAATTELTTQKTTRGAMTEVTTQGTTQETTEELTTLETTQETTTELTTQTTTKESTTELATATQKTTTGTTTEGTTKKATTGTTTEGTTKKTTKEITTELTTPKSSTGVTTGITTQETTRGTTTELTTPKATTGVTTRLTTQEQSTSTTTKLTTQEVTTPATTEPTTAQRTPPAETTPAETSSTESTSVVPTQPPNTTASIVTTSKVSTSTSSIQHGTSIPPTTLSKTSKVPTTVHAAKPNTPTARPELPTGFKASTEVVPREIEKFPYYSTMVPRPGEAWVPPPVHHVATKKAHAFTGQLPPNFAPSTEVALPIVTSTVLHSTAVAMTTAKKMGRGIVRMQIPLKYNLTQVPKEHTSSHLPPKYGPQQVPPEYDPLELTTKYGSQQVPPEYDPSQLVKENGLQQVPLEYDPEPVLAEYGPQQVPPEYDSSWLNQEPDDTRLKGDAGLINTFARKKRNAPQSPVYSNALDEYDVGETLDFLQGTTNTQMFDLRRESALTCDLCIWIQPNFANKFGYGGGLLRGLLEVVDLIKLLNWNFRTIDFNGDGYPENIGFRIKRILLTDDIFPAPSRKRRKRRSSHRDYHYGPADAVGQLVDQFFKDPDDASEFDEAARPRRNKVAMEMEEFNYEDDGYNLKGFDPHKGAPNLNDFSRNIDVIPGRTVLNLLESKLSAKFQHCCAILAFIYHDMAPVYSVSNTRALCGEKNVAVVSGYLGGRKIGKFDLLRGIMHAMGHLFGAPHDSSGDVECIKDELSDFINPFPLHSVHQLNIGLRPNSLRYSACAKERITMFLASNGASCLKTSKLPFCGDGIVDLGEDCDCGSLWQCHLSSFCCGERDTFFGCKRIYRNKFKCPRVTKW